ncbi:MAG: hypothetical protein KDI79_27925 [Anaerolineae bacterium]|nr:hypothetical protein [Anaerolineae bacterium]
MPNEFKNKNEMQDSEDAPVFIDNPKRPAMDERSIRPKRIKGATLRMPDSDEPEVTMMSAAGQGLNLMPPVPDDIDLSDQEEEGASLMETFQGMGDQEGPGPEVTEGDEGYVRLRLRVEGDTISVAGVTAVDGPLVIPENIHSGLVYEATYNQKRIGLGTIPDPGEFRSFPHPTPVPGQEGHHITELPSYEFAVRVPKTDFSRQKLSKINVAVYRIKGDPPSKSVGPEQLSSQFSQELREVVQLKGIRIDDLDADVQEELRQVLE